MEKETYAFTHAKYYMLLAKANKGKGEAIDKQDKLSKAKDQLSDNVRCFEEIQKAQRKVDVEVKAYKHELSNTKEKYAYDQETMKRELDVTTKQLSLSIKIGYNLAINSFKDGDEEHDLGFGASDDGIKVGNEEGEARDL